jgi:hypothetical protein
MTAPRRAAALAAAVLALAACAPAGGTPAASGSCHLRGSGPTALPDAHCTPGATNPAVTPDTIRSTICRAGWAGRVRPPASVTSRIKTERIAAYGLTAPRSRIELDHLVPISLGGALTDVRNLWPEPEAAPNLKDDVERAAQSAVCRHGRDLCATQQEMARDWRQLGRELRVTGV